MINPRNEIFNHPLTKEWHSVIEKYAKLSKYKRALEIGTASGLSAWTIAQNGEGEIVSVDIRNHAGAMTMAEEHGYADRIKFFHMSSKKFFSQNHHLFDLIIVDGGHWKKEVYEDALNGWDVLNSGGYMVFDDYNHPRIGKNVRAGVEMFVREKGARIQQITNKAVTRKP